MTRLEQSNDSIFIKGLLDLVGDHGTDTMSQAFATLVNGAILAERQTAVGASAYERSCSRRGNANGSKPKTVLTRTGVVELRIPKARGIEFYPLSLERGIRSENALKLAVAEMIAQGISTREVREVSDALCGTEISSTQVSRIAKELEDELALWRNRPLGSEPYLILDARNEKVRHGGSVVDRGVLVASGVKDDGKRTALGVFYALSEAEPHWRVPPVATRTRAQRRPLDHFGRSRRPSCCTRRRLRQHLVATLPVSLHRNAFAHGPKPSMHAEVARDLRSIRDSPDSGEAAHRQHRREASEDRSRPGELDRRQRRRNPDRPHAAARAPAQAQDEQRHQATEQGHQAWAPRRQLFPNTASLLRLVSAILVEVDDEWTSGRI